MLHASSRDIPAYAATRLSVFAVSSADSAAPPSPSPTHALRRAMSTGRQTVASDAPQMAAKNVLSSLAPAAHASEAAIPSMPRRTVFFSPSLGSSCDGPAALLKARSRPLIACSFTLCTFDHPNWCCAKLYRLIWIPLSPPQKHRNVTALPAEALDPNSNFKAATGLPHPCDCPPWPRPPPPSPRPVADFSAVATHFFLPDGDDETETGGACLGGRGRVSGRAAAAKRVANAAVAAAHLNTKRGPFFWVKSPPPMAPRIKADPTLRP
mmetsp:Transcript_79216/g.154933  ORF Transcript_79216/g.154933 Transcript_79216/m.154933 type:complete len:267 (-) Transcript_79216:96-896(-)